MFTKKPSKLLPDPSIFESCGRGIFPDNSFSSIFKNGTGSTRGSVNQIENIFGEGRTNNLMSLFNREGCGFDD
jgi:hypothetical protein